MSDYNQMKCYGKCTTFFFLQHLFLICNLEQLADDHVNLRAQVKKKISRKAYLQKLKLHTKVQNLNHKIMANEKPYMKKNRLTYLFSR